MKEYVLEMSIEERDTVVFALRHMATIATETSPSLATAVSQVEGINELLKQLGSEPEKIPSA